MAVFTARRLHERGGKAPNAQAELRRSSGVEAARLDGKVAGWWSSLHDTAKVSAQAHGYAADVQREVT